MDVRKLPVSGNTMLRIAASIITLAVSSIWFEIHSSLVLGIGTYPLTFLLYDDRSRQGRPPPMRWQESTQPDRSNTEAHAP